MRISDWSSDVCSSDLARVVDEPVFLGDLDIRRGSLADEIGLVPERGIDGFLDGSVDDLSTIGRRIDGTTLGIFPTIRRTRNTAELLAGERFAFMIEALRARSEAATILFDLPPAFASADSMIILEQLDGYVLVVHSGKTTTRPTQANTR